MKTENTPENKAKFFAQYFMQPVFRNKHWVESEPNETVSTYILNTKMELSEGYLLLTALKNISDEDAIEVAGIRGFVNIIRVGFVFEGYWVVLKQECKRSVTKFVFFRDMYQPEIDFLRSKGYLLPYMDLSVEDLISYGWVKERES